MSCKKTDLIFINQWLWRSSWRCSYHGEKKRLFVHGKKYFREFWPLNKQDFWKLALLGKFYRPKRRIRCKKIGKKFGHQKQVKRAQWEGKPNSPQYSSYAKTSFNRNKLAVWLYSEKKHSSPQGALRWNFGPKVHYDSAEVEGCFRGPDL